MANVLAKVNTLNLKNKDTEPQKLSEELLEAKAWKAAAIAEYRRSMDFVHRLANRYKIVDGLLP